MEQLRAITGIRTADRIFAQLAAVPWSGRHRVAIGEEDGETASLQIKFSLMKTLPPIGTPKCYTPQTLVYIHALSTRLRIATRSTGAARHLERHPPPHISQNSIRQHASLGAHFADGER
ncbi:hypothetical protein QCM80_38615 [Bradyrhizobium sp. SSUT112]|uniref:hypothetical protein n=1 Tax=Bradyrhizobium sp. SSUT112 TaxID=3040604 RepID=UPI0024489CE2|nr:hypothetical protein [Bradyrhizobium sp. SSUT112]MDH2356509.1 hypothetical protein [Bradyrhizobium sp. SSUT112]